MTLARGPLPLCAKVKTHITKGIGTIQNVRRALKRRIANGLFVLAAMSLLLAARAWSQEARDAPNVPLTLIFEHSLNPFDAEMAFFLKPWTQVINRDAAGTLEIVLAQSPDGEDAAQMLGRITTGQIAGGWFRPASLPELFPSAVALELPFLMPRNPEHASIAAWRFASTHLASERLQLRLLAAHTNGGAILHTRGRRMHKLSQFDGLSLQASSASGRNWLTALGARAIDIPFADVPRAMVRGEIEGGMAPWHQSALGAIAKESRRHMDVVGDRAMFTQGFVLVMGTRAYNALDEAEKAVIDQHSGLPASILAGRAIAQGTEIALANESRTRKTLTILDATQTKALANASRAVYAAWLSDGSDKNLPAAEWLRDLTRIIAGIERDARK